MSEGPETWERVYAVVRQIPPGKVLSYGELAVSVMGVSLTARQVGHIMRFAPPDVPWHRVVGWNGAFPVGKRSPEVRMQQIQRLQAEGTPFSSHEPPRLDMRSAVWMVDDEYVAGSLGLQKRHRPGNLLMG